MITENLKMYGVWHAVVRDSITGKIVSEHEYKNLVPTVGRSALAKQMTGNETYDVDVTYFAVGSGTNAPSNSDTTLQTEVARKAVTSSTNNNNEASIATFFAATEATGTHRELGAFGDGDATQASASADSGILYSRAATNITVGATETLTLTYKITFS